MKEVKKFDPLFNSFQFVLVIVDDVVVDDDYVSWCWCSTLKASFNSCLVVVMVVVVDD